MASQHVIELGSDNWEKEVVQSQVPVLVDFWAPWCGPCRNLAPIIDKIANLYAGKVKVGKVNIDENGELASQYAIHSIPRVLIFKGAVQPVGRQDGFNKDTEPWIMKQLDQLLKG